MSSKKYLKSKVWCNEQLEEERDDRIREGWRVFRKIYVNEIEDEE